MFRLVRNGIYFVDGGSLGGLLLRQYFYDSYDRLVGLWSVDTSVKHP